MTSLLVLLMKCLLHSLATVLVGADLVMSAACVIGVIVGFAWCLVRLLPRVEN